MNGCKHEYADRKCHHPDVVKEEGYIDWCAEGSGCQRQEPDTDRIAEIKARCEAATRGPWEWNPENFKGGWSGITGKDGVDVLFPNHCNDGDDGYAWFEDIPNNKDADFIANAREDIPFLLGQIDRLKMMLDAAAAGQETMQKQWAEMEMLFCGKIARLTAERDAAVKQMCQFCRSIDKKAGIEPVCAASCAWRGVQK